MTQESSSEQLRRANNKATVAVAIPVIEQRTETIRANQRAEPADERYLRPHLVGSLARQLTEGR